MYSKANVVDNKAPPSKSRAFEMLNFQCITVPASEMLKFPKTIQECQARLVDTKTSLCQQWHFVNKTIYIYTYSNAHLVDTETSLYTDIKHRG